MRRLRPALDVFVWSRAAIWLAALVAVLAFEPNHHPRADVDDPALHDVGFVVDVWARWDSGWYTRIAEHGYGHSDVAPAFFPLYPALTAIVGRILLGHYVVAGVAVSLAAFLAALVLLHALGKRLLGPDDSTRALVYISVFPMALFFQAVYTESLYLLLAVASFVLAERGRFAAAAAAAGLALLTRSAAVALLPALVLLAWRRGERRRTALGSLLVAPALFALYPLFLWWRLDDPWAFARAQAGWDRHLATAGPIGGIVEGVRAAGGGLRDLMRTAPAAGPQTYWPLHNVEHLVYLVAFVALAAVAWRRLGAAYGLFAFGSIAIPLAFPADARPLLSLPRFGVVVFPLFLALAVLGRRPGVHNAIVGTSAVLLGLAVVQWALYQWVA